MSSADGSGRTATVLSVTGGAGGLAATYDAVRDLADDFSAAGDRLRDWSVDDARVLLDADLIASAPLSPVTYAAAEAALAAATAGPDGLALAALGWETDALLVRGAIATFEAADAAARAAVDALDQQVGLAVGLALRPAVPLLPVVALAAAELPPEARARLGGAVQGWALDHPEAVEHGVNGSGGLLAGLVGAPGVALSAGQVTRLLAAAYEDGRPVTTRRRDLAVESAHVAPTSARSLLTHLRDVAALSPEPDAPDNGTLEVQTLDAGTDHVRHIVYLPGTDDLTTLPQTQDDDVRDLGTCLRSAGGESTAYQRGIVAAMHEAGIGPHEPVLLVGHSLGGMEAMALAGRDTGFQVTDVVTAGSPTAQVAALPDGVHTLSLEQHGDVVPLLDGRPNPDTPGRVTVTFDAHPVGVLDAHEYPAYVAGATAADGSPDPSVRAAIEGLHQRGYLAGPGDAPAVTSQFFQVTRSDP